MPKLAVYGRQKHIEGPLVVPDDRTVNGVNLILVRSDHKLFLDSTSFWLKKEEYPALFFAFKSVGSD